MKLPLKMPWDLAQTRWASILESVINFAANQSGQSGKVLSTDGTNTKWIEPSTVVGVVTIPQGGTGKTTQADAITALTGTQAAGHYLRSNGTNAVLSAIQAGDVPTLNQNTTGTAGNITATSNSTLTTLSSLSLPGSQITGNISGNAGNVTGTVAIANGGTGQTSANAGLNALLPSQTSNSGKFLTTDGSNSSWSTPSLPSGSLIMYGGSSAPTGWLLCDGSAVSRSTYANLFAAISTTYGAGDGSTTFNIPDFRGIFPRGAGTSGKLTNANGAAFAGTLGTYQNDKMQGHEHTYSWDSSGGSGGSSSSFKLGSTVSGSGGSGVITGAANNGTNGTPRTGTETNPANLSVNFIIAI